MHHKFATSRILTHVPTVTQSYEFRCIICNQGYNPDALARCPGPEGFSAPDPAFAAKLKSISIHPKGR